MGTEIYLLDDATHEALDVGRAYWLAEALIPVRRELDPYDDGDWEFVDTPALPSSVVRDVVEAFVSLAGDRPTKAAPSHDLVGRLLAWLAVRDSVRLATDFTFKANDPGWTVTGTGPL